MGKRGSLRRCSSNLLSRAGRLPSLASRKLRPYRRSNFINLSACPHRIANIWSVGMREAVVVASSRTALAKSFRGSFNLTRPEDLAAHCIRHVLGKTPELAPAEIEDVVLGCAQPHGAQGQNIARISAMLAGLPASVAGTTINRFCSSGLQAITVAAH